MSTNNINILTNTNIIGKNNSNAQNRKENQAKQTNQNEKKNPSDETLRRIPIPLPIPLPSPPSPSLSLRSQHLHFVELFSSIQKEKENPSNPPILIPWDLLSMDLGSHSSSSPSALNSFLLSLQTFLHRCLSELNHSSLSIIMDVITIFSHWISLSSKEFSHLGDIKGLLGKMITKLLFTTNEGKFIPLTASPNKPTNNPHSHSLSLSSPFWFPFVFDIFVSSTLRSSFIPSFCLILLFIVKHLVQKEHLKNILSTKISQYQEIFLLNSMGLTMELANKIQNVKGKETETVVRSAVSATVFAVITVPTEFQTILFTKTVLFHLPDHIFPVLGNPKLLSDFVLSAFQVGGVLSLLSLPPLFILITKYKLAIPNFYEKLFSLLTQRNIKSKFSFLLFHSIHIAMQSTMVTKDILREFNKKLAHLAMRCDPSTSIICLNLIFNSLKKNPSLLGLIHNEKQQDARETQREGMKDIISFLNSKRKWEYPNQQKYSHSPPSPSPFPFSQNKKLKSQKEFLSSAVPIRMENPEEKKKKEAEEGETQGRQEKVEDSPFLSLSSLSSSSSSLWEISSLSFHYNPTVQSMCEIFKEKSQFHHGKPQDKGKENISPPTILLSGGFPLPLSHFPLNFSRHQMFTKLLNWRKNQQTQTNYETPKTFTKMEDEGKGEDQDDGYGKEKGTENAQQQQLDL